MMGQPLIIRIKKGYIRASAGAQPGVARPSRSLIFLPNEFQSRVAAFDQRHGVVCRPVIHDDQFPIGECLRLNAPDGAPDRVREIKCGHYCGNRRHNLLSFLSSKPPKTTGTMPAQRSFDPPQRSESVILAEIAKGRRARRPRGNPFSTESRITAKDAPPALR